MSLAVIMITALSFHIFASMNFFLQIKTVFSFTFCDTSSLFRSYRMPYFCFFVRQVAYRFTSSHRLFSTCTLEPAFTLLDALIFSSPPERYLSRQLKLFEYCMTLYSSRPPPTYYNILHKIIVVSPWTSCQSIFAGSNNRITACRYCQEFSSSVFDHRLQLNRLNFEKRPVRFLPLKNIIPLLKSSCARSKTKNVHYIITSRPRNINIMYHIGT